MNTQLKKLRGVISISLIEGVLWTMVFGVLAIIIGIVDPDSIDLGEEPAVIAAMGGVFGLVAGAAFGVSCAMRSSPAFWYLFEMQSIHKRSRQPEHETIHSSFGISRTRLR